MYTKAKKEQKNTILWLKTILTIHMSGSKSEKEQKKYQIKAENDFDYTYGGM